MVNRNSPFFSHNPLVLFPEATGSDELRGHYQLRPLPLVQCEPDHPELRTRKRGQTRQCVHYDTARDRHLDRQEESNLFPSRFSHI